MHRITDPKHNRARILLAGKRKMIGVGLQVGAHRWLQAIAAIGPARVLLGIFGEPQGDVKGFAKRHGQIGQGFIEAGEGVAFGVGKWHQPALEGIDPRPRREREHRGCPTC